MPPGSPKNAKPKPEPDEKRPDVPRYQPLVIVLAAACAGIVADRCWPPSVLVWWATAAATWGLWLGLWRRGRERIGAVALLLAVAATAASWHHLRWYMFPEDDLGHYARTQAQPVCVEAIALKAARGVPAPKADPMRAMPLGDRARLDLQLASIRDGTGWRPVSGRTRLSVDGDLWGVRAGDRVRVFAQLSAPWQPHNPGEFDYADYVRADRRLSGLRTQFPECVSALEPGSGWSVSGLIDRVRAGGHRLLDRHLDRRRAALAGAVLLGAREQLDPEQTQAFMQTGTIHLLAISGLHVGILAGVLMFVMLRAPVPRGWAMLTVAMFTVFYMLLTDARPPVVRAAILVLVMCWSLYLSRRALSFNSLAAAALFVLAINPAEMFQVGAQLSFLAVAGIMWFAPRWIYSTRQQDPLDRLIAKSRAWPERMLWLAGRSARHLTLISAMIWLLALPLVMARFHLLSPVAIVLNTLLWLPMALALISGFATLAFGMLLGPLGVLFGGCCNLTLRLLDWSVNCARDIPLGHSWVPGPADWWLLGFYGGLGLLATCPRLRPPQRWCLALLAAWSAVGFVSAALRHLPKRLDCTFVSVGHGCAVVLELPSGQTMLYDAGQFGSPMTGTRSIAGVLWSRGIAHLDAVILSHGDLDHYNAVPELLERFSVGVIYVSPVMFENPNRAMAALRKAIDESGVPMREIRGGNQLSGGDDCCIEVLHPPERGAIGTDNANSIVLDVGYLGRHILLTGDLDWPGLEDVLAEEPLDCEVLLAPHHGSRRSNPPGLAEWSTPKWVVISGGRRRYVDLPQIRQTYRAGGAEVLHTAENGAVSVTIDTSGVRIGKFLSPER